MMMIRILGIIYKYNVFMRACILLVSIIYRERREDFSFFVFRSFLTHSLILSLLSLSLEVILS